MEPFVCALRSLGAGRLLGSLPGEGDATPLAVADIMMAQVRGSGSGYWAVPVVYFGHSQLSITLTTLDCLYAHGDTLLCQQMGSMVTGPTPEGKLPFVIIRVKMQKKQTTDNPQNKWRQLQGFAAALVSLVSEH